MPRNVHSAGRNAPALLGQCENEKRESEIKTHLSLSHHSPPDWRGGERKVGVLNGGACLTHMHVISSACTHTPTLKIENTSREITVLHSSGGECRDIPVCPAECVCFGSREGLQASAAVPATATGQQWVTDTGTC